MSAATMQSTPVVPPRPTRSRAEGNGSAPSIPERPAKRFNRPISPNPDRFAPSPLNETLLDPKAKRNSQGFLGDELRQTKSLDLPGVGEEGQEYAAAIEALRSSPAQLSRSDSPEQTRSVADDLKLHAPKPTVPASSAKQRVAAVTRTDSDRAAAFGIGRPSSVEPLYSNARSLKKKGSTTSQLSHHSEFYTDDEHGIPEIGQRVPMLSYAGDVQAPSPAPPRAASVDSTKSARHHSRRTSSRGGFHDLPPGSYGLHGHGVESTDKLDKAYYEKHPDIYQKELHNALHDRVRDYSMSSENLNKIVRDTASRGAGFGTSDYNGTPSEQVAFQASDEYSMRVSSPHPSSTGVKAESVKSHSGGSSQLGNGKETDVIHVDEIGQHQGFVKYGNDESADGRGPSNDDAWPILAADEVAKNPSPYELQPAVPPHWRGGDEPRSRPSSRPTSIYNSQPLELHSTPLEDVEEYEPLFPEDEKTEQKPKTRADKAKEHHQRFPSRDVWEDAPNSVHTTAEVSTPEPAASPRQRKASAELPEKDTETPAQAFARKQEELAEREAVTPDSFLNRQQRAEPRAEKQSHVTKELRNRPHMPPRFPSQDIWEDTPDSLQFTTTVSNPQSPEDSIAEEETKPAAAATKPAIPVRPAKKQGSGDESTAKPVVPNRPKPQVPARPAKSTPEPKPAEGAVKPKPAVPARPMGSKIAALQAGFMSDLNNRLRLGPQAPKKEASVEEEASEEQKVVAPLSDARKGRARGPQRRAPTQTQSAGARTENAPPSSASNGHPVLTFSMTRTLWSIDEEGTVTVDDLGPEKDEPEITVKETEPKAPVVIEVKEETESKETEAHRNPDDQEVPEKKETSEDNNREVDKIGEIKVEEAKAQKEETEQPKHEGEKVAEAQSETSETKTPASSEAQDTVDETKPPITTAAGESVLAEAMDKKEEDNETKAEGEVKGEVTP
ncbi:hypothetical protein GGR50DRAFT_683519 [Xylaria sp. CBS 124048]|nr:hypothetical protein GGR50DRAFT_683519 [Xylaria sp. CBS 124048]